jgi:hypothetical protein
MAGKHQLSGLLGLMGLLALSASQAAGFPGNTAASAAASGNFVKTQWSGGGQWLDPRCAGPSLWARGCPWRRHRGRPTVWDTGRIVSEFDFSGCAYPHQGDCGSAYYTVPHWKRWRDLHRWYGWGAY